MNVKFKRNVATITMTPDQLVVLRYALNHGVEELFKLYQFHRSIRTPQLERVRKTHRKSKRVRDSLELAVRRMLEAPQT